LRIAQVPDKGLLQLDKGSYLANGITTPDPHSISIRQPWHFFFFGEKKKSCHGDIDIEKASLSGYV
jgi:hypothetical protein